MAMQVPACHDCGATMGDLSGGFCVDCRKVQQAMRPKIVKPIEIVTEEEVVLIGGRITKTLWRGKLIDTETGEVRWKCSDLHRDPIGARGCAKYHLEVARVLKPRVALKVMLP